MINESDMSFEPKMPISEVMDFFSISRPGIHQKLKNKGIVCPKIGKNAYINFRIAQELFALPFQNIKIAVEMIKGGTGKTTTVDNLSSCANTYGAKVLMVDADPQANLTDAKSIDARKLPVLVDVLDESVRVEDTIVHLSPGLDIIPSNTSNATIDSKVTFNRLPMDRLFDMLLSSVIDNYNIIIIDLPPSLSCLVSSAILFSDLVIAPINPDSFSILGLQTLQSEIKKLEKYFKKTINYQCFLNKYSGNTILSSEIRELLMSSATHSNILNTVVRHAQEVVNLTNKKSNLFTSLKTSLVRDDFSKLTRELFKIAPFSSTIVR